VGFLFFEYRPEAFWDAIVRAKRLYQDRALWKELVLRAMTADFSWEKAVGRYELIYERLLGIRS
jgi:starch synthase